MLIEKKASAILMPGLILVETLFKKNQGTWYSSGIYSVMRKDVSDHELGSCIQMHLDKSIELETSYDNIRSLWKQTLKGAKLNSQKAYYELAKYVSIHFKGQSIEITPFNSNPKHKMLYRVPTQLLQLESDSNAETIGRTCKLLWEKCALL
jgi:hypothetical protein